MEINLSDLSYFTNMSIMQIIEQFLAEASLDDNKLYLIRMIISDDDELIQLIDFDFFIKVQIWSEAQKKVPIYKINVKLIFIEIS